MKILILNQDWFAEELRSFGHDIITCGMGAQCEHRLVHPCHHIRDIISSLPRSFKPDAIIWHDDSAPVFYLGLQEIDIPVIFYSVDTHHHWELHSRLASSFDHILVAQKDYLHLFAPSGTPTTWMPLWAPRIVEPSIEKTMPLAFVGTMDVRLNKKRVEFFNALKDLVPISIQQGNYWEVFPYSQIVINQTVSKDLNFRVFESMMCGALCLTEHTNNGLLELFKDGVHLTTYPAGDACAAADAARDLLANSSKLQSIAEAGRSEVVAHHTASARASKLHDILKTISKIPRRSSRHLGMLVNHSVAGEMLQRRNPTLCLLPLQAAIDCAIASIRDGYNPSNFEAAHIIRTYLTWDRLTGESLGAKLLVKHAEALPTNYILALARIRTLSKLGEQVEAERVAATISPDAVPQIFSVAEHAIKMILQ
jgi:hypothetical protein